MWVYLGLVGAKCRKIIIILAFDEAPGTGSKDESSQVPDCEEKLGRGRRTQLLKNEHSARFSISNMSGTVPAPSSTPRFCD